MKLKVLLFSQRLDLKLPIYLSFLFAIASPIEPLFSENQNIYLLRGVAKAFGLPLANDWTVNQTDHLFLFTWLTEISYSISPILFYIYHISLSFILVYSLYTISKKLIKNKIDNHITVYFFLFLFIANQFLNILDGLAGQYILGSYFQPSSFGVFLAASIAFFLFDKYFTAIICCLIAAYFHPTYILQAVFLTITYQLILLKKRNFRQALFIGAVALIGISPLIYSLYYLFADVPFEILKKSQEILVYDRIHHHAIFSSWALTNHSLLGFTTLTGALVIFRNSQNIIFLIATPLILSVIFVIFAHLTTNLTMLLMFGQRASVWLMPFVASLLIMRSISIIDWVNIFNLPQKVISFTTILFILILSCGGIYKTMVYHYYKPSNVILKYTDRPGSIVDKELYSFLSSLDYNDGILLIPIKREKIRLNAKVPIFVDWKSHPYKAGEVIEWRLRVSLAEAFYKENINSKERVLAWNEINAKEKVKFILVNAGREIKNCIPIYKNIDTAVYIAKKCLGN